MEEVLVFSAGLRLSSGKLGYALTTGLCRVLPETGKPADHPHVADLITLRCNIDDAARQVRALQEEQLPFIIAKSLTRVAQAAQGQVRLTLPRIFEIRNVWTERGIRITPATKEKQVAEVYTDTSNYRTGAPDYLQRQEEGGERVPVGGHRYLAIPTDYLWRYTPKSRPLPDNLRPSALLPAGAEVGQVFGGTFSSGSRATGTKRLLGRATMRKLGNGEFVAFLQHTHSGTLCIFVRHGGTGYKAAREAEPWYTLVRSAQIQPRLHMEKTVEDVVNADFPEIFVAVAREVGVEITLK